MEKLSEVHIRKALVDKIKETGLKEIEEEKLKLKAKIDDLDLKDEREYELFDVSVIEVMALNFLKIYLQSDDSMFAINWHDRNDVSYVIPIGDLEIWYDSGVVNKYLTHLEINYIDPVYLYDHFFSNGFVSIIERMAYEDKKKNNN